MAKQTFTTGQVLTAAQMTSLQQTAMGGGSATAKTASYVLEAADAGATVIMNAAGATTITVNTSLFSAGDTVFIQNIGAGISTITAGTATVNTASSLALAQYESGSLYFTAAGTSIFSKADGAAAGGGYTPDMFKAVNSSGQSFSANTWTKLTGWTESYDIGSDFATPTWTCPATGYYTFTTGCRIYGGGIGTGVISTLALYKNGTIIHRVSADSVSDIGQVLTATLYLAATDTIEVYVRSELTSPNTAGSEGAIWFEGQFVQS
jgi:hypothetical protein